MKKILAFVLVLSFFPQSVSAATVIFLTSGTSFTTPSDWTTTNTIHCIGSGGNGRIGSLGSGRGGGGGGAYAQVSNLALSGSITYAVALGGIFLGGTYFNGTASTSASVSCQGGRTATSALVGAGGTTAGSIGTIEYAGGNGASGDFCETFSWEGVGGGGGGAGGPYGAGEDGIAGSAGTAGFGGAGGAGFGGAGGQFTGGDGSSGQEWNHGASAGSGGGGAGGLGSFVSGGSGGGYGGGGGGGGGGDTGDTCAGNSAGGSGTQGIIVIEYWPTLSSMIKILGGKTLIQGGNVRIY